MTELDRLRTRCAHLETQITELKLAIEDAMYLERHGGLLDNDIARFRALIDKEIP